MPLVNTHQSRKKLARVAKPRNKITGADLRALAKKKKKGERKCHDTKIKEQCLKEQRHSKTKQMEMGPMQGTQNANKCF